MTPETEKRGEKKHTHSYAMDCACECGMWLSEYMTSLFHERNEFLLVLKRVMDYCNDPLVVADVRSTIAKSEAKPGKR